MVGRDAARRTAAAAPQAQAGQFIGDETCVACHETQGYTARAHGEGQRADAGGEVTRLRNLPRARREHSRVGDAAKIVNPAKLPPQRASETCATCHDRGSHALWAGSQHDSAQRRRA